MIKNILLGLMAAAMLTACHAIWTRLPQAAPQTNFQYVCAEIKKMYEIGCDDLEAPTVVDSVIILIAPWRGVYFAGEKWVFINPRLSEQQRTITLRHEMTHYVLYTLKLIPNNDKCEHERVARLISGGVWGDAQKRQYNCPIGESQ